uniref:Uncharacterized protein n=1 Tax=Nelumbo nucifera TaxID=4432 RepID=A0A822Y6I4_NELNU|nr:TPA_asm: hypothetical protein HUJ06_031072 [Nelumbo nucifera]
MLSALQLKDGVRKGETTYLATLVDSDLPDPLTEHIPPMITMALEEFQDVMPPTLPKKLPPRREVDHKIELEPGTKPPARPPYRMSPPELAELRRQLKEFVGCWIDSAF